MKTFLKWAGVLVAVIVLAVVIFFTAMRFHDGPIEIISGGPFETGEPAPLPADWKFLQGRETIEFQTMEPPTSRTVWLVVYKGRLFLVSGYMTTGYGKIWKQWPHYITEDDRVILRVDGKLYRQRLERIRQGDVIEPVIAKFGEKYGFEGDAEMVRQGHSWLYEVRPRTSRQ